jgi:hypothetical protein
MKNGLFKFYSIFILASMLLFSYENKANNHEKNYMDKKEVNKEEGKGKKSFRHYSRSTNLC